MASLSAFSCSAAWCNPLHGQKCYDTYTNAYWSLFSFSMRIILYEQVSFSLAQAKLLSGFLLQQAQSVFLDLTFCFYQKRFKRNERNPPAGKAVQVSDPEIGLCRKTLRFGVGGIFAHKLFFVCWYPHRSTYLEVFSVPQRSWTLNFEAKIARGTHPKKAESWKISARPSSPRQPQRPPAGEAMFVSLRSQISGHGVRGSLSHRQHPVHSERELAVVESRMEDHKLTSRGMPGVLVLVSFH